MPLMYPDWELGSSIIYMPIERCQKNISTNFCYPFTSLQCVWQVDFVFLIRHKAYCWVHSLDGGNLLLYLLEYDQGGLYSFPCHPFWSSRLFWQTVQKFSPVLYTVFCFIVAMAKFPTRLKHLTTFKNSAMSSTMNMSSMTWAS